MVESRKSHISEFHGVEDFFSPRSSLAGACEMKNEPLEMSEAAEAIKVDFCGDVTGGTR